MTNLLSRVGSVGRALTWPVGVLLLTAALIVGAGQTLGIEQAPEPRRFIIVWAVLAISGIVLIAARRHAARVVASPARKTSRIGRWLTLLGLYAAGLLYLITAIAWPFLGRGGEWWPLIFLLPCWVCLATAIEISDFPGIGRNVKRREEGAMKIEAASGQPQPLRETAGGLLVFLLTTLGLAAALIGIVVAMMSWSLWQRALFKGQGVEPARILETLGNIAADRDIQAPFVSVLMVSAILGIGYSLFVGLRAMVRRRQYRDADRDLTPLEIEHIRASHEALVDHLDGSPRPLRFSIVSALGTIVFLGVIGALVYVSAHFQEWGVYLNPIDDGRWWFHVDAMGIGSVLLIFSIIVICIVAAKASAVIWPRLGEHLGRAAIRDSTDTTAKKVAKINLALIDAVRAGEIGPGRPFNPGPFLRDYYGRGSRLLIGGTVLLLVTTAYFLYLDIHSYDRFSDAGIEHVEYWTLGKRFIPYDEIIALEISCEVRSDDETAGLVYVLDFGNGESALFRSQYISMSQFDNYRRIDAHVREAGVPVVASGRHVTTVEGGVALDRECRTYFEKRYDRATIQQFYALFHVVPAVPKATTDNP